jgi:hypothetical protein
VAEKATTETPLPKADPEPKPADAPAEPKAEAPKAALDLATTIVELAKAHVKDGKVDTAAALAALVDNGGLCRAVHIAALEEGEVAVAKGAACFTAAQIIAGETFDAGVSVAMQVESLLTHGVGEYAKADEQALTLTTSNSDTGDAVMQFARRADGGLRLVGVLETKDDAGDQGPAIKAVTAWWKSAVEALAAGRATPPAPVAEAPADAGDDGDDGEVPPGGYVPVEGALATWLVQHRERDTSVTDVESYKLKDGALLRLIRPEVGLANLVSEDDDKGLTWLSAEELKDKVTDENHAAFAAAGSIREIVGSLGYYGPEASVCDEPTLSCYQQMDGSRSSAEFQKVGDAYVLIGLIASSNPAFPDEWPAGVLPALRKQLDEAVQARMGK